MEQEPQPMSDIPEIESVSPQESIGDKERERSEPTFTRDQLLEAMVAARYPGAPSTNEREISPRREIVERVRGLLDGYKLGVEPDFDYLGEAIQFIWGEVRVPETLGKPAEEVPKAKAERAKDYHAREIEFVKEAHQRLVERKKDQTAQF